MLFGKVSQRDGVGSQYGRAERIARNGKGLEWDRAENRNCGNRAIRKRVPSLKFIVPLSRAYDLFLPSSPPLCVNETGDKRNRVAAA